MIVSRVFFDAPKKLFRSMAMVLLGLVLGLIIGMGSNKAATDSPLSLEALFALCGFPVECGKVPAWDRESVTIGGSVDPVNIFDHRTYSQPPYRQ